MMHAEVRKKEGVRKRDRETRKILETREQLT
jgi:hypothetical protein